MTPATLDRVISRALRRDRVILVASLLALCALAWLCLWREADVMDRMMTGELPMAMQPTAASAVT
jgi:predicted metal-binding membrane protein